MLQTMYTVDRVGVLGHHNQMAVQKHIGVVAGTFLKLRTIEDEVGAGEVRMRMPV